LAFLAATAVGLVAVVAPASAAGDRYDDGWPLLQTGSCERTFTWSSARDGDGYAWAATASVAPVSNCRPINFEDNEFQAEYTTVCGPQ
jgi:hypothetical protein